MKMKSASLKKYCWVLLLLLLTVPAWADRNPLLDTTNGAKYTYEGVAADLDTLPGAPKLPYSTSILGKALFNMLSYDHNVISVSYSGNDTNRIPNFVFGGISNDKTADATHNTITLTGGIVDRLFIGGFAYPDSAGSVSSNCVTVKGGRVGIVPATGDDAGYVIGGMSRGAGAADGNTVTVTAGTIGRWVNGGLSTTGRSNYNDVTVSGNVQIGTGTGSQGVEGGIRAQADNPPTGNHVIIGAGAVIGSRDVADTTTDAGWWQWSKVIGGYGSASGAVDNTVEIKGGTINVRVLGGEGDGAGDVTGNRVTVTGGTTIKAAAIASADTYAGIAGGSAVNGNASDNVVDIQVAATEITTNKIYGGEAKAASKIASGNRVTLWGKENKPIKIKPVPAAESSLDIAGGVAATGGTAQNNTVGIYGAVEFEGEVNLYGGKVGNNGSPDGNRLVLALNDKSLLPLKVNTLAGFAS
ncbi:MAG: hypothetical protein LBO82_02400, partial [Synergistaceae bacterium]|nr:hypothetical protein [Synergistaceae bacterium]